MYNVFDRLIRLTILHEIGVEDAAQFWLQEFVKDDVVICAQYFRFLMSTYHLFVNLLQLQDVQWEEFKTAIERRCGAGHNLDLIKHIVGNFSI